ETGSLPCINIKFRKSIRRSEGDYKSEKRKKRTELRYIFGVSQQKIHGKSGCDTTGYHIGKRVELQTEFAGHIEKTRKKSVEEIKEKSETNKVKRIFDVAGCCLIIVLRK